MTETLFHKRVIQPVLDLLSQGVSPEELALSVALGIVIGVFPAVGLTTTLCAIVAMVWRLNIPAIQIVNYFVSPVQIALLIPFFRLGEKLFRAPRLSISIAKIHELANLNLWAAIKFLWTTSWHAMVAWTITAPFAVAIIYFLLVPLFRRALRRGVRPPESPANAA